MTIDFAAFVDSLRYMGYGMLGIFGITLIIIGLVRLLKALFSAEGKQ